MPPKDRPSLEEAFEMALGYFESPEKIARVVLSGRRRNMETISSRIDIRPVKIKEILHFQASTSDGRAVTTTNFKPWELPISEFIRAGYSNILIEGVEESFSLRITKKDEPLISIHAGVKEVDLAHDKKKIRLLDPKDPFLLEVGISDASGQIKPSKNDKYRQVEEFLRLMTPTLTAAIEAGHIHQPTPEEPLEIVDLGCGHAYLTFAAHQYLQSHGLAVKVTGIDVRDASRDRNNTIAKKLGISETIEFRAEEISSTTVKKADVAIALHACDTATDDAIAWAVNSGAALMLIAPCCHHDIQSQLTDSPEPWSLITRYGIMRERLADLLTDSLRMQILKLRGYRVEAIEFIGGEHTPRNLMIRAVKTGASAEAIEVARYDAMIAAWKVKPALARLLNP
ncbi:MAG: class I SAM-dependent methyltransferase [Candidatus Planktophila sp.]